MSELSIKPSKAAKGSKRFDPAVFFETAGQDRTILKHRKSENIFSQGEPADAVFYIKRQGQSHRRFQAGQGSGSRHPGCGRIRRRRVFDWTTQTIGDRKCHDRMRHHAGGEDRNSAGPPGRTRIFSNVYVTYFGKKRSG